MINRKERQFMDFFEGIEIDQEHLEQTNPVSGTAKMTLYCLWAAGDPEAGAILEALNLRQDGTEDRRKAWEAPEQQGAPEHGNAAEALAAPEQQGAPEQQEAPENENAAEGLALSEQQGAPEQSSAGILYTETRFRTMGILAEQSGCDICVDLPCGCTPRAIEFAEKKIPYIGMDLPAAVAEAEPAILSRISGESKKLVHFRGVDATNYASLEAALEGVEGSLCITTEGLLPYFTESETGMLCDNIRQLLTEHGGCWIISDPEMVIGYRMASQAVGEDQHQDLWQIFWGMDREKADVKVGENPLIVDPGLGENGFRPAMMFLAKHGLKAERMVAAHYLPETVKTDCLRKIEPELVEAYLAQMKDYAFWKITPLSDELHASEAKTKNFDASGDMADSILFLKLKGRLDSISAPNLLAFYEKYRDVIRVGYIDCSELDYISSAGLRVLLIMQKGTGRGIILSEVNDVVREILDQTGFYEILTVE